MMTQAHWLTPEIVAELDPGIREVVCWLDARGWRTADSGDGVTKLAAGWSPEDAEDKPHVHIAINVHGLDRAAHKLLHQLRECGIAVVAFGEEGGAWIQADFDPVSESAMLHLYNLNDDTLRASLARLVGG